MDLPLKQPLEVEVADPVAERRRLRTRPLILIGERHEWMARSLASVLAPRGFDVTHAFTAESLIRTARQRRPDLIVLGAKLPGRDGVRLCRDMQALAEVGAVTPILVLTSLQVSHTDRLEFLQAGAWDCIRFPEQVPELLAKLQTFARAKTTADVGLREGLLDPETGLYNQRGIFRRARDETAEAWRYLTPLATLVLAPDPVAEDRVMDDPAALATLVERTSEVLRAETRSSDVLARLDRCRFGIVTPSTNGEGAVTFAHRLIDRLDAHLVGCLVAGDTPRFQVGCYGVDDIRSEGIDAEKLMRRAETALTHARSEGPEHRVHLFGAPRASD
ncbi:MAG: response regulator [Gemmatimonadales bacterium]|nr:MAG: response regulator [Gemmatimonadales bacterium]